MENLLNQLQPLLQRQQQLIAIQAKLLRGEVDVTLAQRSRDIDQIDHLMDDLFAITPNPETVEDIKRLNEYLATIDTEAAAYYAQKMQEWKL